MISELKIPLLGKKHYVVLGGPYRSRVRGTIGVKMAAEIHEPAEISIPTRDFSIPNKGDLDHGLKLAVRQMLDGETLYVGCMGGRGRTGLFLAILAKAFKVKSPIQYVRQHYNIHAVETPEQERFVSEYVIPFEVKALVFLARWVSLLLVGRRMTPRLDVRNSY